MEAQRYYAAATGIHFRRRVTTFGRESPDLRRSQSDPSATLFLTRLGWARKINSRITLVERGEVYRCSVAGGKSTRNNEPPRRNRFFSLTHAYPAVPGRNDRTRGGRRLT